MNENILELIYILQAFTNDLQYMALHCVGENFAEMKTLLLTLESEGRDEINEITETAILDGMEVDNINNIKSHLDFNSQWPELNKTLFYPRDICLELKERGTKLLQAFENATLIGIFKDMYIHFWGTQILLDNEKRLLNNISVGNVRIDIK